MFTRTGELTWQDVKCVFGFHVGKWGGIGKKISKLLPIGAHYPPEVRGKVFETSHDIQDRTCEHCGKIQVREIG